MNGSKISRDKQFYVLYASLICKVLIMLCLVDLCADINDYEH